jgi:hypothetical protein
VLYDQHKYITYGKPRIGKDRSLPSNALSHVWYDYADKMLSEQIGVTRRYCKLHFGVPIMRAESEDFRRKYDKVVKPHDYETKLLEIMDILTVTSLMSREQMHRYLTAVQVHYANERGLVLEAKGEFQRALEKQLR